MPTARDARTASFVLSTLASILAYIPDFDAKLAFWGLGAGSRIFGGSKMSTALNTAASIESGRATLYQEEAGMASRTATYERRADDWLFQANAATRELMQQGRQLIASIVAEQAARHEYENVCAQIEDSQDADEFLRSKFTSRDLHHWMQGELSRLHRLFFDFAVYTARKAETAVKHELMRPELDANTFIRGDYWDGGRKGLLAGENLHFDLKRLEVAYLEHNKYEDILTKQVSIRRLDPLALLTLQATGSCEVTIPEWLFDLDRPGHYMRRIRSARVTVPAVVGPYAGIAPTLTLLRSSIRLVPGGANYARTGGAEDARFKDLNGAIEVTMNAAPSADADAEPPSARDQFLPYEGHGVESAWRIDLPAKYRQFEYSSISDIVLQIRYTARSGGVPMVNAAVGHLDAIVANAARSGMAILVSVPDEFPAEWSRFVAGNADLQIDLSRDFFPYLAVGRVITLQSIQAYAVERGPNALPAGTALAAGLAALAADLNDPSKHKMTVTLPADAALPRVADRRVFVIVRFAITP
jgi:NAD(P)-dependent dehydrogenase (short-subunit alcohol dehydrogenase family)